MTSFTVVVPSFRTGGAERVAVNLAEGLAAAGERTTLLAIDPSGPLRPSADSGLRVAHLGRRRARWAAVPLLRWLRATGPQVVVVSQTHLSLLLCLLAPLLPGGTRIVVREPTLRGLGRGAGLRPVQRAMRQLYPRAALVVASSAAMEDELRTVLSADGPRVVTVPNPVDVERLRSDCGPPGPRTRGRLRLVTVGRLVATKAVDEVIRLLAGAPAGSGTDGAQLRVVGDGPELPALRRLADELGVGGRVDFLGHLDRTAPAMAEADVLVVASRLEGMPNVVLEALAVGTPVLATTDLGALEELADEAPAGAVRLVPRDRLGAALADLTVDPSPRPRPSLLPARYTRDAVVEQLLRLLR